MTQRGWLVSFSPRRPWFYPAALYVVSELARTDGRPITILPMFHVHSPVIRGMDNGPLGAVVPMRTFVPPQDEHTMAHLSLSVLLVLGSCTYTYRAT